jgi:hypothetical protein
LCPEPPFLGVGRSIVSDMVTSCRAEGSQHDQRDQHHDDEGYGGGQCVLLKHVILSLLFAFTISLPGFLVVRVIHFASFRPNEADTLLPCR